MACDLFPKTRLSGPFQGFCPSLAAALGGTAEAAPFVRSPATFPAEGPFGHAVWPIPSFPEANTYQKRGKDEN